MTREELVKIQDKKNKELSNLLTANVVRYNKMNSIAFDFFITELVGERDAKEEYKEQFYRAKETTAEINKLKEELRDIAKKLTKGVKQ